MTALLYFAIASEDSTSQNPTVTLNQTNAPPPSQTPRKNENYPDYKNSAIPTTADNFLITVPIPLPGDSAQCAILVFPQQAHPVEDSLRAGLDRAVEGDTPRSCERIWITVGHGTEGYVLEKPGIDEWNKVLDEFHSDRILSPEIDKPNDWVAALWHKTMKQHNSLPVAVATLSQDPDVYFVEELGSSAFNIADADFNKVISNEASLDPLAKQEMETLSTAGNLRSAVYLTLDDMLENLNSYTWDQFHQAASSAHEADSFARDARDEAANGQLEVANGEIQRAQMALEQIESIRGSRYQDGKSITRSNDANLNPEWRQSPQTVKDNFRAYATHLASVAASRGFRSVGHAWLIDIPGSDEKLIVQPTVCKDSPDGHCQKLFISLDGNFIGTDTFYPSWRVHDLTQEAPGSFSALYDDLSDPNRILPPTKVIYTWDGQKLIAHGTPPTRPTTQSEQEPH